MALTVSERAALAVLRARINPQDPGHASTIIPAAAQPYIDTWIIPVIEYLEGKGRRYGDREQVLRDYAIVCTRQAARNAAK